MSKISSSKNKSQVIDLRNRNRSSVDASSSAVRKTKLTAVKKPIRPVGSGFGSRGKVKPKKNKLMIFLLTLLVLLVAAAVAGFIIFGNQGAGQSLRLTLVAPKNAASGEVINLELSFENLDKVPLTDIELAVQYPEGFYFDSANILPDNAEQNVWHLSDLGVGARESLSLNGQLIGELNQDKNFTFVFNFKPENFQSDFQEIIEKSIKINDEFLKVDFQAPENIEEGQSAMFKAEFTNQTKEKMKDLLVAFDFDEGFKVVSTIPTSTVGIWSFTGLAEKEVQTVELSGLADPAINNPQNWSFNIWQEVDRNGQIQKRYLYKKEGTLEILSPQLDLAFELVDPEAKLAWGETVGLKLKYKNTGKTEITEAVLNLQFNDLVDWEKFANKIGAVRDKNKLIILSKNSEQAKFLASIAPETEGELIIDLPLKNLPEEVNQLPYEEISLSAQATVEFKFNGLQKTFSSEIKTWPIQSQSQIMTEARYYLTPGTVVGSGPVPPQIGQETTYRIYWKLFTGSEGLAQAEVKTSLPAYINFQKEADQATFGSLQFDQNSRQLTWNMTDAGPSSQLMVSFDLAVTPSADQVNQLLILTNATTLAAKEKNTGQLISKTNNLLTSDLLGDPVAQGKGRVTVGE